MKKIKSNFIEKYLYNLNRWSILNINKKNLFMKYINNAFKNYAFK